MVPSLARLLYCFFALAVWFILHYNISISTPVVVVLDMFARGAINRTRRRYSVFESAPFRQRAFSPKFRSRLLVATLPRRSCPLSAPVDLCNFFSFSPFTAWLAFPSLPVGLSFLATQVRIHG